MFSIFPVFNVTGSFVRNRLSEKSTDAAANLHSPIF